MFCFDAFGRVVAQSAPGRDPRRVILSFVELGAGRSARCEHQCSKIQDHCGNAKIAAMRRRCRLHHPFSMWCIAFAATSQWKTVNDYKGPTTTAQRDDYCGRWRVISAHLQCRSIAWTKRGFEKAALEVIAQSWEFHTDITGQEAPFDLDVLKTRYLDDVGIVT